MPLTLFAVPDQAQETNHFSIDLPVLGSLILTHQMDGVVHGLKDVPPDQRPPVAVVFYAFRIMVGIGLLMLALVVVGLLLRLRGTQHQNPLFLRACEIAGPFGLIAVLAGWTVTEVGRQPWLVYGLVRTRDSVPPSLTGSDVLISLIGYMLAYVIMYPAGIALMARIVRRGVAASEGPEDKIESGRSQSPILAATTGLREQGQ